MLCWQHHVSINHRSSSIVVASRLDPIPRRHKSAHQRHLFPPQKNMFRCSMYQPISHTESNVASARRTSDALQFQSLSAAVFGARLQIASLLFQPRTSTNRRCYIHTQMLLFSYRIIYFNRFAYHVKETRVCQSVRHPNHDRNHTTFPTNHRLDLDRDCECNCLE
jgi:hypothetical protein